LPYPAWLPAVVLGLVTLAVYWPAMQHDFVNYDDDVYVTANARVQGGLTLQNIIWAFTHSLNANWHPLTVLSHMLDCQLFGLNPWGQHLTNVLLHAGNTALVFLLLRTLTGAVWRSVMVAALFGWHPVHVESAAWVAERKDVLSTCFGLLALLFYARYAESSKIQSPKFKTFYCLSLLFFACGLMSKAMLVTWPLVLLLLDYWPFGRWKAGSRWLLVREKIPFFVMAAAASIVTFMVQKHEGALQAGEKLPLAARGGNALVSYCRYLEKIFWPADLAVFYPHPGHWPAAEVLLAGGLVAGLSAPIWSQRRRYPFLLMGWLWFLGTLLPVIQLVQTGNHAMADRYTYVPSLGVFIVLVWGAYELAGRWRILAPGISVAGGVVLVLCVALTRQQLSYWQDSETLFRHTLAVTENNDLAHNNLGDALNQKGQIDDAMSEFQEAIRLKPDSADAHYNLGKVLVEKGRLEDGISQYQEAIRLKSDYVQARNNLARALGMKNAAASH
jgi:tetratricopeptide (TPR) repeat protein